MGFFDSLMGNASEVKIEDIEIEYEDIFSPNEIVEKAYKLIRDIIVFTNKRLILINKQGVSGKKIEYMSVPYKSIAYFSVETTGHFDLEAELKIYVSGRVEPIEKQFSKNCNVYEIQALLSEYICK